MRCHSCHSEVSFNAAFCDQCGERLETACPNCAERNRHGANFCRHCGHALSQTLTRAPITAASVPAPETYTPKHLAEKILASRHKLEGERKQVTVLFADIRGSTTLIEALDPEDAQKIIDPVLRIMMDAVHRYEGTVSQILGDGIVALFGAPLAHEDHALRASYAALAMQDEMRRYRQRLGQSEESGLQIGIGINSGAVVVRSIDNDLNIDYSALGHTTNLAARMQELAGPGIALMSTSTLQQVEGFVQVQALGLVQVKGVSQPVEAFSLTGVTTARTRVQARATHGLTPLVGRNTEVDIFKRLVQRASAGRGQILAMIGEPGVGKSRLVHEFTRHQLPSEWLVLEATSVSYGKATSYFPLIELLRRYFQIGDGENSKNIRNQVVTRILELDSKLKDTIPPVLSLLDALSDEITPSVNQEHDQLALPEGVGEIIERFNSIDPEQRRRYTLDGLKRIWIRESQRQNLLLVFEDLHWIDPETQAFLDTLVDSLAMARIILLVNYRPHYDHEWSEKSYYTQLRVDPLQMSSAEELLSKLLGTNPDLSPLKQLLIKRTEGNPFFAEESVRSLKEAGVLTGEMGAYRAGLKIDGLVVPSTVQNVVADRIDRLPIEEKHLLQTAAIIGMIVPFSLLRAVTELQDEDLYRCLAHLQSSEFLYETNLFPELEYTFKHALTNEVTYSALLHDRRTDLHARVLKALEGTVQTASHDRIEKLAHHAFTGEIWEKAVGYLKEAGDAAALRSSFRNAVLHFERALEALQHLSETTDTLQIGVDIRFELRNAFFVLGNFQQGYRYLEEARTFALKLNDRRRLGMLFNFITAFWNLEGNSEEAVTTGKQALEYAKGPEHLDINTVAHYFLGVAYHNLGSYTQGISELKTALSLIGERVYDRFGTTGIVSVICKSWLVRSLAQLGQFADAILPAEEAIQTAKNREHPYSLVYAYYGAGVLSLIKGEIDDAIGFLERGLEVCEASDIAVQRPLLVSCLSTSHAYAGRLNQALELLESETDHIRWITGPGDQQLPFGKAMRMVWLSETYLLAGRLSEAEALAGHVMDVLRVSKDKGSQAWLHRILGDAIIRQNRLNVAQAESNYTDALQLATELGMRPLQAHCLLALGQLHGQEKNFVKARSQLLKALELYQGMEMPYWLEKANTELRSLDSMPT